MEFYRASYTSIDGSITDFIVPVKLDTQIVREIVVSAFHQLTMLKVYSGEFPSVDDISVAVVFSDDPYRRYYIASDMLVPPNISHFYFSHVSSLPFVITGEPSEKHDIRRKTSSIGALSSLKIPPHSSNDVSAKREHLTEPKMSIESAGKSPANPSKMLVVESDHLSPINPNGTITSDDPNKTIEGSPLKESRLKESNNNDDSSSSAANVKITFLSDSDSTSSSDSSSSEDDDEKRIREERRRKEEAEKERLRKEKEKKDLEEERKKKMQTSFFDESDSSSLEDKHSNDESPTRDRKPSIHIISTSVNEHMITVNPASASDSSSSSSDSSSSSSSESEEEQHTPTAMGMLSSLLQNSTPIVRESKPAKKVLSKPQVLTSSGPSRSFKNIYKDGDKKEEIEVPTPILPVAADGSKRYKKRQQKKAK